MIFETLKGTKDIEPKEQIILNNIINTIKKNFELYGFRPFDTPIIEFLDILTLKYDETAEIVQEIFKTTDRGNRELGLRYDLTTPLSRFVASKKQLKKPFKRYQIGKVFRDGPIKRGRVREFTQCDADIIGLKGIEPEAETLFMFYNTYKELEINAIIELNNNKILRGSFLQFGFEEKNLSDLILSVDKLKKIGEIEVLKEIKEKGLDYKKAKKAIDILSSNDFKELNQITTNEILKEGIEELEKLTKILNLLNVNYRINFSMSRGLDIYTGNIWEVYDLDRNISSSIGSGGRYDKVIGDYIGDKKEYPAFGVSYGLVPIYTVLEKKIIQKEGITKLLIVPLKQELTIKTLKIANEYRKKEINTEIFYGYKLSKAFDYCDYLGIEELIVIGEKDIENKEYTLKNLKTKEETKIKF